MENFNLSAPWEIFYSKITQMFGAEQDIILEKNYNDKKCEIKFYVAKPEKADALEKILPTKKTYGNIDIYLTVIPPNKVSSRADLFATAFEGNPVFSKVESKKDLLFQNSYVVFKPKVVQFYADNTADIEGRISTLYHDIAYDIFDENMTGISFCIE